MMSAKIAESEGLRRCGLSITDDIFDFNREWCLGNDDRGYVDDGADDDDYIHERMPRKNSTLLPTQATVKEILILQLRIA